MPAPAAKTGPNPIERWTAMQNGTSGATVYLQAKAAAQAAAAPTVQPADRRRSAPKSIQTDRARAAQNERSDSQ